MLSASSICCAYLSKLRCGPGPTSTEGYRDRQPVLTQNSATRAAGCCLNVRVVRLLECRKVGHLNNIGKVSDSSRTSGPNLDREVCVSLFLLCGVFLSTEKRCVTPRIMRELVRHAGQRDP